MYVKFNINFFNRINLILFELAFCLTLIVHFVPKHKFTQIEENESQSDVQIFWYTFLTISNWEVKIAGWYEKCYCTVIETFFGMNLSKFVIQNDLCMFVNDTHLARSLLCIFFMRACMCVCLSDIFHLTPDGTL